MNAFRLFLEGSSFVVEQMGKAGPADLLQCRLDAHHRIENNGRCMNDRWGGHDARPEPVASLRLAARLDLDRCHFEQPHGNLIKRGGVTAAELELDLADRLGPAAATCTDFALVDCRRYAGGRGRFDRDRCAGDIGRKKRPQIFSNPIRQMPPALRRLRVGTVFGNFILPLAAAKEIAGADARRLDGLDEPAVLLSDAKADAPTFQRQIGSIVIGADQPPARAGRWRRHLDERSLQLGQIGCRGG